MRQGVPDNRFNVCEALTFSRNFRKNSTERNKADLNSQLNKGGVRVCGIAVLGYFWCGVAVIFISKYGIAVFRVQAVCGKFKFYVAVVGEKIIVSQ